MLLVFDRINEYSCYFDLKNIGEGLRLAVPIRHRTRCMAGAFPLPPRYCQLSLSACFLLDARFA
jgi:hypothetical protein